MKATKKKCKNFTLMLAIILAIGVGQAVNVNAKVIPQLNYKKITIVQGKKKKLKIEGIKKNRRVKWRSTKKSIATVNQNGVVKAKKKGVATIIATVGERKYRCKVTVKKKNSKKSKYPKSIRKQLPYDKGFMGLDVSDSIGKGTTVDLFFYLYAYGDDMTKTTDAARVSCFKWHSSNPDILSINKRGIAKAKKAGTVRVSCKYMTYVGKWQQTKAVKVKIVDVGNVKISYSAVFEKERETLRPRLLNFEHTTGINQDEWFNVLNVKVTNNSSYPIVFNKDVGFSAEGSTSWFGIIAKENTVVPAHSTITIRYDKTYFYYLWEIKTITPIDFTKDCLQRVSFGYKINGKKVGCLYYSRTNQWTY